jgi:hypothetical protein
MTAIYDGGRAFPSGLTQADDSGDSFAPYHPGLSVRDYFIAAALAGICGHSTGPVRKDGETGPRAHARWAVDVANAVMQERDA